MKREKKIITWVSESNDQLRSSHWSDSQHPACTSGLVKQQGFQQEPFCLNKLKFSQTGKELRAVSAAFHHEANNILQYWSPHANEL